MFPSSRREKKTAPNSHPTAIFANGSSRNGILDENQSLPSFHQLFTWGRAVAKAAQLSLLWWQVPVGNMSLPNTNQRWRDNCVVYLMAHTDEVAAAHGVGIAFGAGNGETTTPETDGGHLVQAVTAHALAPQPACP